MITLGVLYPEHSQLSFDCVIIACSLQSIRPGLVHGCKAPNGVRPNQMNMVCTPYSALAGTRTHDCTIGPSQAIPSLLIGAVLSSRTDMWGAVTNTGNNGMPTKSNILGHSADANPLSQTRIYGRQAMYIPMS